MCRRTPLAKHWNLSEESYIATPHRDRQRGESGQSVKKKKANQII